MGYMDLYSREWELERGEKRASLQWTLTSGTNTSSCTLCSRPFISSSALGILQWCIRSSLIRYSWFIEYVYEYMYRIQDRRPLSIQYEASVKTNILTMIYFNFYSLLHSSNPYPYSIFHFAVWSNMHSYHCIFSHVHVHVVCISYWPTYSTCTCVHTWEYMSWVWCDFSR